MKLLGICLSLYEGIDDRAAKYLQTLEVETLIEAMNALFNANEDEARTTETPVEAATANA